MLDKLQKYMIAIKALQSKTQSQLDNMDITDSNEELAETRQEKIDLLDQIIESGEEFISLIEEYNSQWNGLISEISRKVLLLISLISVDDDLYIHRRVLQLSD